MEVCLEASEKTIFGDEINKSSTYSHYADSHVEIAKLTPFLDEKAIHAASFLTPTYSKTPQELCPAYFLDVPQDLLSEEDQHVLRHHMGSGFVFNQLSTSQLREMAAKFREAEAAKEKDTREREETDFVEEAKVEQNHDFVSKRSRGNYVELE